MPVYSSARPPLAARRSSHANIHRTHSCPTLPRLSLKQLGGALTRARSVLLSRSSKGWRQKSSGSIERSPTSPVALPDAAGAPGSDGGRVSSVCEPQTPVGDGHRFELVHRPRRACNRGDRLPRDLRHPGAWRWLLPHYKLPAEHSGDSGPFLRVARAWPLRPARRVFDAASIGAEQANRGEASGTDVRGVTGKRLLPSECDSAELGELGPCSRPVRLKLTHVFSAMAGHLP